LAAELDLGSTVAAAIYNLVVQGGYRHDCLQVARWVLVKALIGRPGGKSGWPWQAGPKGWDQKMNDSTPIVQKAFELARSGAFTNTNEIRKALAKAGYSGIDLMHISPSLSIQLRKVCSEARS
jgi:hypothetical protein